MPLPNLVSGIRSGRISPLDLTAACLARIDRTEPALHAWQFLDRAAALAAAAACTAEAAARQFRGELHGIPVAVKDIVAVAGLPNECGSPLMRGNVPTQDAEIVARLRRAGAIVLGKTVTTEFAYFTPGPTANPWNPAHTPGGSSSGSAAAVSAGQTPLAIGTQTVGSILRPASFCGCVGFKPGHGWLPLTGVHPFARSFDTLGLLTREVESAWFAYGVLRSDLRPLPSLERPPRLLWLQEYFWREAEPAMQTALALAAVSFIKAGADVVKSAPPPSFAAVAADHRTIMAAEAALVHMENFSRRPEAFGEPLANLIEQGMRVQPRTLSAAHERREIFRRELLALFGAEGGCLLLPAARGDAPLGLGATGDPAFNGPWTYAGLPAVALPMALAPGGLPLGLQLVGPPGGEAPLMAAARWCEDQLRFSAEPPLP
ncbi:MAG: amidase [Planctomycetota bacterium]